MVGIPILVMVFSHLLLKEKFTTKLLIGITLGFTGSAYLILNGGSMSVESGTFLGNLFILINASSYGLFLVLVKPLMVKYHPITIMKWIFTLGLVYIIPFSFYLLKESDFTAIPTKIWFSIAYVILFTTILAYFLNNYSLKRISPTVNSAYIYLQPFITTMLALTVGDDMLGWPEIIAAMLIFTGVYFVNQKNNRHKKQGIVSAFQNNRK
jgi:drug/metabolite transporter (DMT)-like permease